MMDLLVLVMTGAMENVEHITAKRVNSLSPFGHAVMEEQGVGITPAEFDAGKADGSLAGHVGFQESAGMIAAGMGVKVTGFSQDMEPIITDVDRKSKYGFAAAGTLAGVNMTAKVQTNAGIDFDLIHPQQIEPEQVGISTGDYINIKGSPEINLSNTPEVEGGIGTYAMVVNMIPHVINAKPGLRTMIDLPVPRAIMGDFRDFIEEN
jgi:4-hydroxy-tetrahydrodipicolinate reductase